MFDERVVIVTTDGEDRESCSVFYATVLLVRETDSAKFQNFTIGQNQFDIPVSQGEAENYIRSLGFDVRVATTSVGVSQ